MNDIFFKALAKHWPYPSKIIVTGAWAAQEWGSVRPTQDIDFEIQLVGRKTKIEEFQKAVQEASRISGLQAQFSTDIDRWSQITYLDYRKWAKVYKKFNKLTVTVMDPLYWSIGKIARFWDQDLQDLIQVFKSVKPDPIQVALLWNKALRKSPQSNALFLVKKNALYFFKTFGPQLWGKAFQLEKIEKIFIKTEHRTPNIGNRD